MVEKTEQEFQNQEVRIFAESEIVKYQRINTPILDTISNRANPDNGINYVSGPEPWPNVYVEELHDDAEILEILKKPNPEECPLARMGMTWDDQTTLLQVLAQVQENYFLVDNKI